MPVEYRFATTNEYTEASNFLRDNWSPNHIYIRDKALFDWTFHRRGHWPRDSYSIAVAEDAGEWVGMLGGIPFTFNFFGTKQRGAWIVNYVIRPDHRKGVTALKLLSMFRNEQFDSTIAFGITQASTPIYKVLRGEVLEMMPRHVLVLRGAAKRMERILALANPEWPVERCLALSEAFEGRSQDKVDIERSHDIPADWDERGWRAISLRTVGAERNMEYLQWRYVDHPSFEHRVISVPDGPRSGLLVWRLETIRRMNDDGTREDVDRFGRMLEFLPASENNAAALLAAFECELQQHEAVGADYYGYHGATARYLQAAGFVPTAAHPDGCHIPSRFQPLDRKGGNIMSAMFLKPGVPRCTTQQDCQWYWTKSDSDQDRPN